MISFAVLIMLFICSVIFGVPMLVIAEEDRKFLLYWLLPFILLCGIVDFNIRTERVADKIYCSEILTDQTAIIKVDNKVVNLNHIIRKNVYPNSKITSFRYTDCGLITGYHAGYELTEQSMHLRVTEKEQEQGITYVDSD